MSFAPVQAFMKDQRIDAWLLYDFRGNNPVLAQLLPGKRWTTRRAFLFIPAAGDPILLAHSIDAQQFEGGGGVEKLGVTKHLYLSWRDLRAWLEQTLTGHARVAMEYAPGGALPAISIVDAGTVELVRSLGVEVVSSADLIQVSIARWSPEARRAHAAASDAVTRAKDSAFAFIADRLRRAQLVTEHDVQQYILAAFAAAGLETPEPPIVAVNAHSGDPHFEVSPTSPAPITRGDWVLIDLWARQPGDEHIFSDITWVGYAGERALPRHREVFNTVKQARDAALQLAQTAWRTKQRLQGWQLDDAARHVIIAAGHEPHIRHRTGHSLSPGPKVHGLGVNLDNLETHDTREVLPGIGFTIEPGVYLPGPDGFGVRLEINVFVDPQRGPEVTSCIQDDIVLIV